MTVIAIVWLMGGLLNISFGLSTVIADLTVIPDLSNPSLSQWFQFGIPAEMTLYAAVVLLGIVQLATIYGLWTGRPWSYRMALGVPILNLIVGVSALFLYASAPASLGLLSSSDAGIATASFVWMLIFWGYLRRPHVKDYLNIRPTQSAIQS